MSRYNFALIGQKPELKKIPGAQKTNRARVNEGSMPERSLASRAMGFAHTKCG